MDHLDGSSIIFHNVDDHRTQEHLFPKVLSRYAHVLEGVKRGNKLRFRGAGGCIWLLSAFRSEWHTGVRTS